MSSDGGLVPQQVDGEVRAGHKEDVRPVITDDLIGEMQSGVPRVVRLGRAPHALSTP